MKVFNQKVPKLKTFKIEILTIKNFHNTKYSENEIKKMKFKNKIQEKEKGIYFRIEMFQSIYNFRMTYSKIGIFQN